MTNLKNTLLTLGLIFLLGTSSVSAATAATVNGMKITVKEANKALKTDKDGGLKTLGILLNALESNKKIHY